METNSNKLSESNIKLSINKSESNEILNNDSHHISNNISKNVAQEENNEDPEIEAQNYYNSLTPEEKKNYRV